ncbi:MAG TPA: 16S rRNA (guanine(966)-N(2))-methyltransferase RsmD [Gemmatimonadaceae bacterium]|nr:16S rRNA (guanine(966)-N(2))-methyltransferase RsmD [Gemmatimonadaceae bacterium]
MRIVAGRWRGRRIKAPDDDKVRPTGDRVREAWLSIVNPWLAGARVVDLFSGSGALGLEALSRGAEIVDFVELAPKSLAAIRSNLEFLGNDVGGIVHREDALAFVRKLQPHAYDVAFADPPYDQGLAAELAEQWLVTPFADILGIEHRATETLPGDGDRRRYGSTVITFYRTSP